jgi:hypothetical protein
VKIEIHLPRAYEADTKYDEKKDQITVKPVFVDTSSRPLAYLSVMGEKGRERKYTLRVSGQTGRVTLVEAKEATCRFDTLAVGQDLPDEEVDS